MKRNLSLLLCLAMVLTLFAGCSAKQGASETAPPSTSSSDPAQAASNTPAQEPVTIHLFHQKQEAQETFAKIIDAFHDAYPYITVEQEIVTNDPSAILKARIATDEVPDIFQGALDTMDIAQGGYIMDLAGEPFLDNITGEALRDASFTDADGHTWAMPVDGSCEGIFYNKDIFAAYDLTPPKTLSEFDALLETLRDNGVTPFALGFKDAWTIKPIALVAASPAVYAIDADWNAKKSSGQAAFADTPAWTTSFELLKKVYENGNTKTAFDTDYNGACAMVARGEAAMMVQGLWALEPIKSVNPDVNLGMMAMPVSENPDDTKLFQFPDFGLSISASTPHPEACKRFLEFLTRPDSAELWCSTAKLFSAVKGVSVDFDPLAADVNAYIDAGMVSTQADRGWPTAFQPEFEAALPNYLLDKASLPDILNSLDSAWDTAKAASQS
ncbi:extracellular solute-binding protein [Flavonifractor sp. DFI.6.63]|uniref:ABC transporter substrate-binding protein n=1 Tax=Oscillospiraceae TaxID=216572 RepID=UPI00210B7861|nr:MULTISPECIES: extracellular solute-binding protein [Oscillospiraceae]MCI6399237.1 extracellular solute-binding protein [Lawsonibacter sp.]MCQ5031174.1 extracellular solute-binding protein [Flavonifractor sp. DFI.6.63]MDY2977299.1 extracellular solute-binding protein [Oscillospiraceae bacterium]